VVGEDAVGPDGGRHEEGIGPKALVVRPVGHDRVHLPRHPHQTALFQVVLQALGRAGAAARRCQGLGRRPKGEHRVGGEERLGRDFTLRAHTGDIFPCSCTQRQLRSEGTCRNAPRGPPQVISLGRRRPRRRAAGSPRGTGRGRTPGDRPPRARPRTSSCGRAAGARAPRAWRAGCCSCAHCVAPRCGPTRTRRG